MNNSCAVFKESITRCIILRQPALAKQFFCSGQALLIGILLQDNQVTADFCTCIVGKQVIGQPNG
ncbi:hypothetical protein HDF18_12640 [Mucilaginibacter sp. X5P1]|uniref:hypothetical protein n=1 Tax=Mucilaginibacter sp. X5P1 TaxID=2723088 RepID=UPI0016174B87|nr:hypothetical protein [Mucilaginibacter sp. X5P1]MBB6140328.1 hypothetical protein [Mucilaginibacter sp. X5P1]